MADYDVIIIGGGPAGLTAALYSSRAGLKTLLLEKGAAGGQISSTSLIENWPGTESATGPQLTEAMAKHAKKFGAEIMEFSEVSALELADEMKKVKTRKGEFRAKALILATGTREKKLGVKGETELKGKGVSYCATCDAPFYRGRSVVVVGGGNSALEEAGHLSKFADSVTVIHRRAEFRAEKAVQDKAKSNPKMKFLMGSTVEEITGKGRVEAVKVKNLRSNSVSELKCDGVFIYVGMVPNSELAKDKLELDEWGYIKVNARRETSAKGVFAAGDVTDSYVKQVTTAAGDGTIAAVFAGKFISGE